MTLLIAASVIWSMFRLVSTLTPNTSAETTMQLCGDLTTFLVAPSSYTKERMITIKQSMKLKPLVKMDVPSQKESVKARDTPLHAVSSAAKKHLQQRSPRTPKPLSSVMRAFVANSPITDKPATSRASNQSSQSLNPLKKLRLNPLRKLNPPSEVLHLNR